MEHEIEIDGDVIRYGGVVVARIENTLERYRFEDVLRALLFRKTGEPKDIPPHGLGWM